MTPVCFLFLLLVVINAVFLVWFFLSNKKGKYAFELEKDQHLKSLYRASPSAIGVIVDRVFKDVNPKFEEITGYSYEETVGQNVRFLYESKAEYLRVGGDKYRQISYVGTGNVKTKWVTKSGNVIDILLSSSPMNFDDLSQGVVIIALDISPLEKALQDLSNSEQRYRAMYDNAPLAYQSLDENAYIKDVNPQWLRVLGYDREDVVDKSFSDFLSDEFRVSFDDDFLKFKKEGKVSNVEYDMLRKDGGIISVSFEGCIQYDNEGNVLRTYCTFKNISDQKAVEKRSYESAQRLELALQIGNISIFDWNLNNNSFFSDGKIIDFLGYDQSEGDVYFHSLIERWKELLHHDDRSQIDDILALRKKGDSAILDHTVRLRSKSGDYKWIRCIVKAIEFNENGDVERLIGLHVNVDQEKRQEIEAYENRERVMRADKLSTLGTLAAGVAHEINNPNQFILSNVSLLQAVWCDFRDIIDEWVESHDDFEVAGFDYSELRERYPQVLDSMMNGSRRIKSIVQELKDYVRDNKSRSFTNVDINRVIYSSQILTANLGKKKTNSFSWEHEENLFIRGDSQKLEQVFVNLIINAFEALSHKSQSVKVKSYLNKENQVTVDVIDEGVGISESDLKRIRDPFYTTKQQEGGTGMGLSVVDSIVKEHEGSLKFITNVGEGTCARVVFNSVDPS